jgi:hypothetical protein
VRTIEDSPPLMMLISSRAFFSPLHHPGFVFGSTDEDVYAVTVTCLLERVN